MDEKTEVVIETPVENDKAGADKSNDETDEVDVENDHEMVHDEVAAVNAAVMLEKSNDDLETDVKEEIQEIERPKSTNSCLSASSSNSIPPLPLVPTSSHVFTPQRSSVISSLPTTIETNKFSASFLATPSSPVKSFQKRTLTKSNSDGFFRAGSSAIATDKDSQLIGVSMDNHLGPQCTIRRKIQFDTDDAFIKTFQLYWYVDSLKGCLESPILSSKRLHNSSHPIETPYFVITKNQRRHQAYSCTFCKGKTTFITIVQALRHLKANHRHNVRVLVQDPKGVFNLSTGSHNLHQSVIPTPVSVLPWTLPPRQPFVPLPLGPSFNISSGLLSVSSVPTSIPSTISPYIPTPLRPLQRTTSDIPAEALDDTSRLTSDNITYLKNILSQKLNKTVVEVTPRGGDEVTVVFSDNKSRVVRLANENTPKSTHDLTTSALKTSIPVTSGYEPSTPSSVGTLNYGSSEGFTDIPKAKLLRTVSATVNPHYNPHSIHDSLRAHPRSRIGEIGDPSISSVSDSYYQAPTKSKYAAKMDYINKKNEIDTAKTHLYKNLSARYNKPGNETDDDNSLINGYDTDPEVKHDSSNIDARSIVSNSTCTIDIDSPSIMDQDRQHNIDNANEEAPSLHGNSVQNETKSPQLKICDYSTGAITEHAMLKLKIEKSKLESKNLNFSVENGAIKMDKKTQNQYYNSFVKIQVLSLSHRCKICSHITTTEPEMSEHITEHSLKELMNFS